VACGIMAGVKKRASCREIFKKFNYLPLRVNSFSLLLFFVENMEKFRTNFDIHNVNTRHKYDLHMLNDNLTSYQKGAYYAEITHYSSR
jgi:hypothetical protein